MKDVILQRCVGVPVQLAALIGSRVGRVSVVWFLPGEINLGAVKPLLSVLTSG